MWLPLTVSLAVLSAAPATTGELAATQPVNLTELTDRLADDAARIDQAAHQLGRTCTDVAEQLDGDGKPEHVFEEKTRVEWVRGKEAKAILSAKENGEDATARRQEKLAADQANPDEGRERGNYGGIDFSNPFRKDAQPQFRFTLVAPKPGDGDLVRIHFAPRGEPTPTLNAGEALVDRDGSLISITAHPSDYPSFVDFVHFRAEYGQTPYGPVQTSFQVEGQGGFLFVHKHYREQWRCEDFQAAPLTRR
jgi:hypothetical protein